MLSRINSVSFFYYIYEQKLFKNLLRTISKISII